MGNQARLTVDFAFEPEPDGGSRVTAWGRGTLLGLLRAYEPVVERELGGHLGAALVDLKRLLEGKATRA
jgi:hypothetical protein